MGLERAFLCPCDRRTGRGRGEEGKEGERGEEEGKKKEGGRERGRRERKKGRGGGGGLRAGRGFRGLIYPGALGFHFLLRIGVSGSFCWLDTGWPETAFRVSWAGCGPGWGVPEQPTACPEHGEN